ncbi:unnamed protein product [Adineta ricciae]|uniref:C3H1-type domain-containing protein n=1 Tax=Adineta ricciae TaxID=249248 RepID=A0A814KXI1_ADIRI|nr:unnamed protein product [Adineta ricciae]
MAEYLASIFGTEKDKVNCSFYFKIGACRHGERCSRVHNKPTFSQTILLKNLYLNPNNNAVPKPEGGFEQHAGNNYTDHEVQQHFDEFYEEVYTEVEDKFRYEKDAEQAVNDLNTRWFDHKPIYAELSPVTDFKEASCRQYELGECMRSGFCNFMHIKTLSPDIKKRLRERRKRSRSRSRSPARRNNNRRR